MHYDSLRATRSGGSNTGVCEIFRTRPHRLWKIPRLLHNEHRVFFPRVRRLRRGADHPPTSSPEIKDTASSNKNTQLDATINRKIYCFVVQTLLNMFRALLCPSSGARQTDVAASGFRMNVEVEVFSAVVGLLMPETC